MQRVLPSPICRMKDEAATRLDRSAMMHRAVRRFARLEIQLAEESTEADPRALVPDADPDRAILVVDAHCDHRALEPRVGHARHRQEELARKESWLIGH